MTSHELAAKLLKLPDGEVMVFIDAQVGYTPVDEYVLAQANGEIWLGITHEEPWKRPKTEQKISYTGNPNP